MEPMENFAQDIEIKSFENPAKDLTTEKDSITEKDSSTEITKKDSATEITKKDSTTEIKKDSATEITKKDSSTEITKKDSATEITKKDSTTEITKKDSATQITDDDFPTEDFDETVVTLDPYNSDLHLEIDAERFSAKPITTYGFGFMWAGARATHGASSGKFCFEVKILQDLNVNGLPENEPNRYLMRVGFSVETSSLQLGEDNLSYAYDGTGKIATNCQFTDFGEPFEAGDVILGAVEADSEKVNIGFAKNGKFLGWAYQLGQNELKGQSLFPHILTKNISFEVNMGQKEQPYFPLPDELKDFTFIGSLPIPEREGGTRPPKKKEECEVIMMWGLPASGKTTWVVDHAATIPSKKYNVLGLNYILDKMTVMGLPHTRTDGGNGNWNSLIHRAKLCMVSLINVAPQRKRNYILDQNNLYPWDTSSMMRTFDGFQRRAVVVLPSEEEYEKRMEKRESERQSEYEKRTEKKEKGTKWPGKMITGKKLYDMKANCKLPKVNYIFNEVVYTDLQKEDAEKLLLQYKDTHKDHIWTKKKIQNMSHSFHLNRGGPAGFNKGGERFRGGRGGSEKKRKSDNNASFDDALNHPSKYERRQARKLQKKNGESSKNNFRGGRRGRGGYYNQDAYDAGMDYNYPAPQGSYGQNYGNSYQGGQNYQGEGSGSYGQYYGNSYQGSQNYQGEGSGSYGQNYGNSYQGGKNYQSRGGRPSYPSSYGGRKTDYNTQDGWMPQYGNNNNGWQYYQS